MNKLYNFIKNISINAEAVRSFEADPLQAFRFRVSIPGIPSQVGFQKVGGLNREMEVATYIENMFNHEHKLPGREKVGDVTFERGMYADNYLKSQYESIFTNKANRTTVVIQIVDRFGNIRKEFKCAEAWFSKYELGDLDASSNDVIIETLTMVFEYFL